MFAVNGRPAGDLSKDTQATVAITGPDSYDLFVVTGIVQIEEIWGRGNHRDRPRYHWSVSSDPPG